MATSRTGFSENRIWNVTRYYWNYYRNYQFISSQITGWPIRPLSTAIAVVFVGIQFRFRETHFWTGILTSLTALSVDFAYRFFTVSRIYFFNPRIKGPPESPSTYALDALPGNNLAQSVGGVDSHKHTPLPHNDSFRLLLLKGGTKDILECEIIEMSTDTIADYEALSYTWGSPTPQKYILCNGKRLPITENCEAALRHLRLPLAGRLLWVDSICIDQSSIIEKNQQVRLMGHIYSRAKDVMIWLGPGTPESDIAPQYIHLYARLIDLPQTLREYFEERVKLKILRKSSLCMSIKGREAS
jgi:hypothetical protein